GRGVSTAIWTGEAGMPATIEVGTGDCSFTPVAPSNCTCAVEIGNEFTAKDGRSPAMAMALPAMARPAAAATAPVTTTEPAAAIVNRTLIPNSLKYESVDRTVCRRNAEKVLAKKHD